MRWRTGHTSSTAERMLSDPTELGDNGVSCLNSAVLLMHKKLFLGVAKACACNVDWTKRLRVGLGAELILSTKPTLAYCSSRPRGFGSGCDSSAERKRLAGGSTVCHRVERGWAEQAPPTRVVRTASSRTLGGTRFFATMLHSLVPKRTPGQTSESVRCGY